MIYFVVTCNGNCIKFIQMFMHKDDAFGYILDEYIKDKLDTSPYYVVHMYEKDQSLEKILEQPCTYYRIKYRNKRHVIYRYGNAIYDIESYDNSFKKLELLNKLCNIPKNRLYYLYKQIFSKDCSKLLTKKKWIILELYKYLLVNKSDVLLINHN